MSRKVDFDEYAETYNAILENQLSFFDKEEYFAEYKVRIISELSSITPQKVLDYGCGVGRSIPFLQSTFPNAEIFGTDISQVSLKKAQAKFKSSHFLALDKALEYTGKFEIIFVAGVFHHIPLSMRSQVMQQLSSMLADEGELYIFEHNPFNPITRHMVNTCPYDEDAILLKSREFVELFESAKLNLQQQGFTLFFPLRLKALRGLERYLRWLPLGGQYFVQANK